MTAQDSATQSGRIAVTADADATAASPSKADPAARGPAGGSTARGTVLAALGVVSFSLTFPGTVWALDGFGPWALIAVRSLLAGLLAGGCLLALRVRPPKRQHWAGLAVVAAGVVVGFPLLTTLALQTSTSAHAAVVVGLLPLTTALFSALRTGSRPRPAFWVAAVAGAAAVLVFTVTQSGGAVSTADLYLFAALLICAAGYTEGGRLARVMPGWQVIGWALVLCLPLAVPATALTLALEPVQLTGHSIAGMLWLAVGSQWLGLVVWYRGMGVIGVPKASQLQLAQPLLTLGWAVLLLGEELPLAAPLTAVAVLVCIAVTQRRA
ncbi:DMT family transporter [Streptomyces sp. NPDC002851]